MTGRETPRLLLCLRGRVLPLAYLDLAHQDLFATHIDLSNAFWSFVLPSQAASAFGERVGPGGPIGAATRLPFGWKFSPYFCRHILGDLLRADVPTGVELVPYLDNFVLVSTYKLLLGCTT